MTNGNDARGTAPSLTDTRVQSAGAAALTNADVRGLWPLPGRPDVVIVGSLSPLIAPHDWTTTEQLPAWVYDLPQAYVCHFLVRVNGRLRFWVAVCVQEHETDEFYVADFVGAESLDSEMVLAFGDVMAMLSTEERETILDRFEVELSRPGAVRRRRRL